MRKQSLTVMCLTKRISEETKQIRLLKPQTSRLKPVQPNVTSCQSISKKSVKYQAMSQHVAGCHTPNLPNTLSGNHLRNIDQKSVTSSLWHTRRGTGFKIFFTSCSSCRRGLFPAAVDSAISVRSCSKLSIFYPRRMYRRGARLEDRGKDTRRRIPSAKIGVICGQLFRAFSSLSWLSLRSRLET